MKYIKLYEKFENWKTVSDEAYSNVQDLHEMGVVSDNELSELRRLRHVEREILQYPGVGNLNLDNCPLLKSLPDGLKVNGMLNLNKCTGLESLPADLQVIGYLALGGCTALKSIPANLRVRDLTLIGCTSLESLPTGLIVDRN